MTHADLLEVAVAEVRRLAATAGIKIHIDDDDPTTGDRVEVGFGRSDEWDQLVVVRMAALPGGTGHLAHIRMPTAPSECVGQTHSVQVAEMFAAHAHRRARIAAIEAAGLDPFDPPLWSLHGLRATRILIEATSGRPLGLARSRPQDVGTIELQVEGSRPGDLTLSANGHIVTSPATGGWDSMVEGGPWRYAVSDERPRITIYGVNLPETVIGVIADEGMTLGRIVDDETLSGLDLVVRRAENSGRNLILHLSADREWHAPLPAGTAGEWREGLS